VIRMPIEKSEDIAKLLNVTLIVPEEVGEGEEFPITLEVTLDEQYNSRREEILAAIADPEHKNWSTYLDICLGYPNDPGNHNQGQLIYSRDDQVFDGGVFRFESRCRPPLDCKESVSSSLYAIAGRVRLGSEYHKGLLWNEKSPWTDIQEVTIVRKAPQDQLR